MIPILQNDYYKYVQMFRGNYLKGATLFKALLNDTTAREQLIVNLPALSAVFTDFSNSEANRMCYDILSEKSYFEDAVMNYLQGIEATTYTNMTDLINDENAIVELLKNNELKPLFYECLDLYKKVLKKQGTLDLLKENDCTKIVVDELTLSILSEYATKTTTNIYTSYNTYINELNGKTCSFDANETYYSFNPLYDYIKVDDATKQVFLPVQIRTRVGTTSTYYYYPAVFKYSITNTKWELLYTAMTSTKITSSYKTPKGIAYDPTENLIYFFYRQNDTVRMNCDIINCSTGIAKLAELNVGEVGGTSYMDAIFCSFDKTYKVAKFVWDVASVNSTNTTYGRLYGCSVNKNGLVWQGIVAAPKNERTSYSSEMQKVSYPYKYSCSKGGYVCVFSNTSSSSTAITLGFIVHSGNKMTSKYIQIPANSEYSDFYSPSAVMTENGLLLMYSNNAIYQSSSRNVVLAIDIVNGKIIKDYISSTSYSYSLYVAPLIKKVALKNSNETEYVIIGEDENKNAVELKTENLPSIFTSEPWRPVGTERYKIHLYSSGYWYLYDCKGGFTE